MIVEFFEFLFFDNIRSSRCGPKPFINLDLENSQFSLLQLLLLLIESFASSRTSLIARIPPRFIELSSCKAIFVWIFIVKGQSLAFDLFGSFFLFPQALTRFDYDCPLLGLFDFLFPNVIFFHDFSEIFIMGLLVVLLFFDENHFVPFCFFDIICDL